MDNAAFSGYRVTFSITRPTISLGIRMLHYHLANIFINFQNEVWVSGQQTYSWRFLPNEAYVTFCFPSALLK